MSETRRLILVTGAMGGIGSALVSRFVDEGHTVVALDRVEPSSLDCALGLKVDLVDPDAVRRAASAVRERLGPVWGLVNVAGDNIVAPTTEFTDQQWRHVIDANLSSTFYCCRAFLPDMVAQGEGRIVNFSSVFGLIGQAEDVAYCAAKAGIVGLTRALASEYASAGIQVNAVAPAITMTDRIRRLPPEFVSAQVDAIPMGRPGSLEDLTETVGFLLSDGASYFTGQTLSPNGGQVMT